MKVEGQGRGTGEELMSTSDIMLIFCSTSKIMKEKNVRVCTDVLEHAFDYLWHYNDRQYKLFSIASSML